MENSLVYVTRFHIRPEIVMIMLHQLCRTLTYHSLFEASTSTQVSPPPSIVNFKFSVGRILPGKIPYEKIGGVIGKFELKPFRRPLWVWLEFIWTLKDTAYNGIERFDFHKKILGPAGLRFRFQIYFNEKCEKVSR